jgi:enoyl-CoA hydratase
MAHELIEVRTEAGKVGIVTLNRPKQLNALNNQLMDELGAALKAFDADPAIGCMIITGSEKAFAAGADIGAMASWGFADVYKDEYITRNWETIRGIRKPVIAAVSGFALGGGCELAMACHLRVAAENARFGQPEVKLGLSPGYGGTVRLPRLVGKGRALELLLTAGMIDAAEAHRIGLVNRVVPAERLLEETEQLLRSILENGPLAVQLCIESVDAGLEMSLDQALLLEANHFGFLSTTADMREGTAAFLEKRKAKFEGK